MKKFLLVLAFVSTAATATEKKYYVDEQSVSENRTSENGFKLSQVREGSSAYAAGLRTGDLVEKINGKKILTAKELEAGFEKITASVEPVPVTVNRDGKELNFVVRNKQAERGEK